MHAERTDIRSFGKLDLVIVNAATAHHEPMSKVRTSNWEYTLRTNLTGVMCLFRRAGAAMIERVVGSVLAVESIARYFRVPAQSAYQVGRTARAAYASALAVELAPHGIRSTC